MIERDEMMSGDWKLALAAQCPTGDSVPGPFSASFSAASESRSGCLSSFKSSNEYFEVNDRLRE